MDETPVKAGRKKKGKMQQAWYWPLLGDQLLNWTEVGAEYPALFKA